MVTLLLTGHWWRRAPRAESEDPEEAGCRCGCAEPVSSDQARVLLAPLSAAEVDEVFTVPVADLLELTPTAEVRLLAGQRRTIYSYAHRSPERERLIWGLTGTVVADLLATLRPLL